MDEFEPMTAVEVAELLKIPLRTVRYLTATGQMPASRIGKRAVRYDRARIREWFKSREAIPYHTGKGQE